MARRQPPPFVRAHIDDEDEQLQATLRLPAGHFLARQQQQPVEGVSSSSPSVLSPNTNASSPIASTSTSSLQGANAADHKRAATARPDTTTLAAADFDVSVSSGFLPPQSPIISLSKQSAAWRAAEERLSEAQEFIKAFPDAKLGLDWVHAVRQSAEPDAHALMHDVRLVRRAHVLLAFLSHLYVHASASPSTSPSVPPCIARPFVIVSDKLGLPPVLTYADTVLWNWAPIVPSPLATFEDNYDDADEGESRLLESTDLRIVSTFTGTSTERAFFLLSLLCELRGAAVLRHMALSLDECFFADDVAQRRIATHLQSIATHVRALEKLMDDATKGAFARAKDGERAQIDPDTFYWRVRPWFNAGRWTFRGARSDGGDLVTDFGGPSAGQSTLVHALDLFLGIDHRPRPEKGASSSSDEGGESGKQQKGKQAGHDETFMMRMASYMPLHHRAFLSHLRSLKPGVHDSSTTESDEFMPPVRALALAAQAEASLSTSSAALASAYDDAVLAMRKFRDSHMRLVARFIIAPARHAPPKSLAPATAQLDAPPIAKNEEDKKELKGTGGTNLVKFLKECRLRTREAELPVDGDVAG